MLIRSRIKWKICDEGFGLVVIIILLATILPNMGGDDDNNNRMRRLDVHVEMPTGHAALEWVSQELQGVAALILPGIS